jgi:heme/copper-type cytochrome/quinol oxidase subunit 3
MTGRLLDERWGRVHFWLSVIGFNLTFFVQHFLGVMGMPRRVFTYPDLPGWGALNMASTVGAFVLAVSVIVFAVNMAVSLRQGKVAGDNPWDAWTLEWATTSPPVAHNFDRVPPVRGRRPLWDLAHPDVTSGRAQGLAEGGLARATHASPPASLPPDKSVVAVWAFIVSESSFFAILIVSYVVFNLSTKLAGSLLDVKTTGAFTLCLLASSVTLNAAERNLHTGNVPAYRLWLIATVILGLVFLGGQAHEYTNLYERGVTVDTSLFASAFFTLTGFHGLHVMLGLAALGIFAGLALTGRLRDVAAHALRPIGLYWHFVDAVWVVVFTVVYLRNLL